MAPRLTEQQIEILRPRITEYPERLVIPAVYPPARRKRGASLPEQAAIGEEAPGALPSGGLTGGANVALWAVMISSNTGGTSIRRGSPAFIGPALLHSFTGIIRSHTAAGVVYPAQLAYDSTPYQDTDVGASLAKLPGTHIITNSDPYNNAAQSALYQEGFIFDDTTSLSYRPIGIYIPLDKFYLGLLVQGSAAGAAAFQGVFRIIQNAPPESISWI